MENAVKALEYAFAVLAFIIALTVSINALGKAKTTSDLIFHSTDPNSFYLDVELTQEELEANGRIVGVESIIPTLYRDYKENYVIEFYTKDKKDLILRLDLSEENRRREIWTGNPNVDVKKRLDILISGGQDVVINHKHYDGVINNQGYRIADDYALKNSPVKRYIMPSDGKRNGLYEYCKGKQFVEEYAYILSDEEHGRQRIVERIDKIVIRYVEY